MLRPRFTLTDLLAVGAASAVGLAWVAWLAPGRSGPASILIAPLLGILWQRSRGGRGILGGMMGGAVHALLVLLYFFSGYGTLTMRTMAGWPAQIAIMSAACLFFGMVLGLVAWSTAAIRSPRSTPDPLRLKS